MFASAAGNTYSIGALLLALVAAVPGFLAYRQSKRDTDRQAEREGRVDAVSGFDKLTERLTSDNESLRSEVSDLRARVAELERRLDEALAENARLRIERAT